MNRKQLRKLGVPEYCIDTAVTTVQQAATADKLRGRALRDRVQEVLDNPTLFVGDSPFSPLAQELLAVDEPVEPKEPVHYRTWGTEIDDGAHQQMQNACAVPSAVAGALMADAHIGYGLPIGGVLALENAVIPYAVGVDIACRMKMTVTDMPVESLDKRFELYKSSLSRGTVFGVGKAHQKPQDHAVMDQDWTVSRVTRQNKDRARKQLGTSGSGNHFAEFGKLTLAERDEELGLDAGEYVALLSHSGSRGTGASVCDTYSNLARSMLPRQYSGQFGRLGWLDMDSQEGREYWAAMNLMGDYASANHDVLHRLVMKLLGARVVTQVENHHNFAWLENHGGKDVVVHRKGATPAGEGVLGVIPGSMASPAFVVRGKGEDSSLHSAAHGAGRRMSRRKAKEKYNFNAVRRDLEKKGVRVLAAGADEVPGVYKDIHKVMAAQSDLVDVVARFYPKIVRMCGDGSRAED